LGTNPIPQSREIWQSKDVVRGIYKIENLSSGNFYIGSAVDVYKRFRRHYAALSRNSHYNVILQRAWNRNGESKFRLSILEIVPEWINLLDREDIYLARRPVYNIGKKAYGGDNLTNHPRRLEIIEKIGIASKRRWAIPGIREAYSLSITGILNPHWKGGHRFFCACGAKIAEVNVCCIKCRDKSGDKNPFFGKKHSPDLIEKISKKIRAAKVGVRPPNARKCEISGVVYDSFWHASLSLGINQGTIRHRCMSPNKKFSSWKLV